VKANDVQTRLAVDNTPNTFSYFTHHFNPINIAVWVGLLQLCLFLPAYIWAPSGSGG